ASIVANNVLVTFFSFPFSGPWSALFAWLVYWSASFGVGITRRAEAGRLDAVQHSHGGGHPSLVTGAVRSIPQAFCTSSRMVARGTRYFSPINIASDLAWDARCGSGRAGSRESRR